MSLPSIQLFKQQIQYRSFYVLSFIIFISLVPIDILLCYYVIKRRSVQSKFQWRDVSVTTPSKQRKRSTELVQNVDNDWNNSCTLNHARMSVHWVGEGVWFLWTRSLSTEKLKLLSKRNSPFIQTQGRLQRALESLQVAEHNACKGCGKSAIAHAKLSVTQRDCSLDCLTRDKRRAKRRRCSRCVTFYFFHAYTTTDKTRVDKLLILRSQI